MARWFRHKWYGVAGSLLLGALVTACQQPAGGDNPGEDAVSLQIIRPVDGATVSAVDTIAVTVQGSVRRVDIRVDSLLVKTFFTAPYQYRWLAGYWADGQSHRIQAMALDDDNKLLDEAQVEVVVPASVALVPTLEQPIADAILTNPEDIIFRWQEVAGAQEYVLQISRQVSFQSLVRQELLQTPSGTLRLPDAGQYYWRVRAVHASGKQGPWSEVRLLEIRRVVEAKLSSIQALVFDKRCAIPNCHVGEYAAQGLDLSRGNSYEHLVYVKSFEVPSMYLVEPFASARSYLITKLEGGDSLQGALMPLTGPKLTQAVIDSIKRWIDIGAPQN